jgi:hypothetical protein
MKRTRWAALAVMAVVPVCLAACGGGGDGGWEGVVRDSAGVQVVENTGAGVWGRGEAWGVDTDLLIGTAEGDAELQFGQIVGIDVGQDGRIYVMDQQAHEVRVFDADGRFVTKMGQAGSGPGELSQAAGPVFVTGDGVAVPDLMNQRISWYDGEGTPVGSHPLPITEGIPTRWMKAHDGLIIQQAMIMSFPGQAEVEPKNLLLRRQPSGELVDTLLTLPIGQTMDFSGGQPSITMFESEPMWTPDSRGRLISGNNSEYRLEVYSRDGSLERVVTRPGTRQALSESDQAEFRRIIEEAWNRAGMPPQQSQVMASALSFARHYPAYANLLGGPDGSLWVQSVQTPETIRAQGGTFDMRDYGGPAWDVFDVDGRFLGVVMMPARFTPMLFDEDRIYGVQRDDMDVQHVARLTLRPTARAPVQDVRERSPREGD